MVKDDCDFGIALKSVHDMVNIGAYFRGESVHHEETQ